MKSNKKEHFEDRKERNGELQHSDGRHNYGKTESGIDFLRGVRSGKLNRIDKTIRKTI